MSYNVYMHVKVPANTNYVWSASDSASDPLLPQARGADDGAGLSKGCVTLSDYLLLTAAQDLIDRRNHDQGQHQ